MTIRQRAYTGLRWNGLSKGLVALGGLIQLYLLIRYLDPADFGLMAMVNVSLAFTYNFLDFGVNNAIVHKTDVSPRQLSSLYWFTILLGLVLGGIFYVLAPLVARFYETPPLTDLLRVLSLVFVINAFGNQFKVLLIKELRFNRVALIDLLGFAVGFVVTVGLALRGRGVYALVYGTLARTVVEALASVGLGGDRYRPSWHFRLGEARFFIQFGLYQMGERLLYFFNKQADLILVGKFLGPDLLGVYDVIKRFLLRPMEMIHPVLTGVTFPLMAKLQFQTERLRAIYLRQINYLCALNFPIYLLLFLAAEPVIVLMFGEAWLAYVWVFRGYVLVAMSYSTGNPVGTLLLAKGRAEWGFYWNLVLFFLIPMVVYGGLHWQLEGVVMALLLSQALLIFPNFYFLVRPLTASGSGPYFWQMLQPLLLSLAAVGFGTLLGKWLFTTALPQLLAIGIISGGLYLGASWYFHRQLIHDFKALLFHDKA